jgi:hypothetical protein
VRETRQIKEHTDLVAVGAVDDEFGQRGGVKEVDYTPQVKLVFGVRNRYVEEIQRWNVKAASRRVHPA